MMLREDENEEELRLNMDLFQEKREPTAIREVRYKTKMAQYYNQKVRITSFKIEAKRMNNFPKKQTADISNYWFQLGLVTPGQSM
ncbi:hypothetical protein Tco_1027592 [Tanacetum coccineum]